MDTHDTALLTTTLMALGNGTLQRLKGFTATAPLSFSHPGLQIVLASVKEDASQGFLRKTRLLPEVEQEILEKYGIEG